MGKKRLSERTAPFVVVFSGLSALGRILANPPHTVGDYVVLAAIVVGVGALVLLGLANVRRHKRRALAVLAPLHLPFTMLCDVDVESLKRFGGWGAESRLKVARTQCFVATDGNVLQVSPVNRRRDAAVGPRPCAIDISRAPGGYVGTHLSDTRPALVIPVPYTPAQPEAPGRQEAVQPVYLIRRQWSDLAIHSSPLARFALGLPA